MSEVVKRGFYPNDKVEFSEIFVNKLLKAGRDLQYLLNQGYKIKGASTFVGNHYLLSERQRLALVRGVSSEENIKLRKMKEIVNIPQGSVVHIDGYNTIITLEVALSNSLLLKSMDGTIRDLASLRGTYRLIDKTEKAILLIGEALEKSKVKKVNFYLDSPVSNSGRLKQCILQVLSNFSFEVEVELITNVDYVLKQLDNVITSDAIILDECTSWINLNATITNTLIENCLCVDFTPLMKYKL